jgi:hypothetical protein
MRRLLEYDHGKRPSTKKYYPEPLHPSVSLLCKWIFGENKRDIDNQHGVELDLLAANQPYSPTGGVVATSDSGDRVVTSPC